MRLALALGLALASAAGPRSGCGAGEQPAGSVPLDGYRPCQGKACGAPCTACPPGASDCGETAVVKACDAAGRCVPETPELSCPPPPEACAGKACGDECLVSLPCHFADPPCLAPQSPGRCDIAGACVAGAPGACEPHPDCAGKPCGASCNPCGPERVCPTLIPSACDRYGRCGGDVPGICDPPRP